jgi:hypothetical protein
MGALEADDHIVCHAGREAGAGLRSPGVTGLVVRLIEMSDVVEIGQSHRERERS